MTQKDMAIVQGIKSLASATMIQAAKDYCEALTPQQKKAIVKDLNNPWMDFLTNGMSRNIAEALQRNENKISKRLENIHIGGI